MIPGLQIVSRKKEGLRDIDDIYKKLKGKVILVFNISSHEKKSIKKYK